MLCEVPLTKEQQTFATAHHSLVYKFLNENRLPEDEFYDVVIFGYLKAVRDYFSAHDPIMQQLEMDLLLHELAGRVSKQQMDIVHLKQGGYGIREIARTQKVPMRRIKELLAEVHDVLLDICYG